VSTYVAFVSLFAVLDVCALLLAIWLGMRWKKQAAAAVAEADAMVLRCIANVQADTRRLVAVQVARDARDAQCAPNEENLN